MKNFLKLLLLIALLPCCAQAQPTSNVIEVTQCPIGPVRRIGFDFLGLYHPSYDAKGIGQELPAFSPIGVLDSGTFGSDPEHLEILLKTNKVGAVRIHFIDGACIRNEECQHGDIGYNFNKKSFNKALEDNNPKIINYLKSRAATYKAISDAYPCIKWYASPVLEHNLTREAYVNAAKAVLSMWPGVSLVNCHNSGWGGTYLRSIAEFHGIYTQDSTQASSLDGESLWSASAKTRNEWRDSTMGEHYTLSWIDESNCRKRGDSWQPPKKRDHCVTKEIFIKWRQTTFH